MKYAVGQKIKVTQYCDPEKIPDGSEGEIIETCGTEMVLENFKQPMYMIKFTKLEPLIKGMSGSWLLEEEIETND